MTTAKNNTTKMGRGQCRAVLEKLSQAQASAETLSHCADIFDLQTMERREIAEIINNMHAAIEEAKKIIRRSVDC